MPASLPVINGSANNWGTLLNAWLQVAHNADGTPSVPVTSVTGTYTVLSSDTVILADATSGAFTTTLPTAAGISGKSYTVLKSDSSSNTVTVGTTSGQLISGQSSFSLPYQYSVVTILSDGSNWEIVYTYNTQKFSLANNMYKDLFMWTVTGQTDDPLPSFGTVAGSQTYGSSPAIQGPAFWFGYNP